MLGFLHICVDIGFYTTVPLVIIVVLMAILILVDLLTTQALEEVGNLLIAQGVRQVLRDTLEAAQLTHAPVGFPL